MLYDNKELNAIFERLLVTDRELTEDDLQGDFVALLYKYFMKGVEIGICEYLEGRIELPLYGRGEDEVVS